MSDRLTEDLAVRFARIALGHVTREFPNAPEHVQAGAEGAWSPRDLHPVFYGSFDWHSCVHSYWMLARLLARFPGFGAAGEIRALFDAQLTPEKVEVERAYFDRPTARGFKRPYGWAWLLKLSAELKGHGGRPWAGALQPLADVIVRRFEGFLPLAVYPIRAGTHGNTAFALRLAADYAETAGDAAFLDLLRRAARDWYGADAACPAWGEPSLDDFQSPALVEAEAMRRLLPTEEFEAWFDRFLPGLAEGRPAHLLTPATVTDRSDGKIAHLDGLNLSRAWCWRSLAGSLPDGDPRRALAGAAADRHLAAGLPHIAGDYMGEHWLASFAVLALEAGAA